MAKACASKGRAEVAEATVKIVESLRNTVEIRTVAQDTVNGTKQGIYLLCDGRARRGGVGGDGGAADYPVYGARERTRHVHLSRAGLPLSARARAPDGECVRRNGTPRNAPTRGWQGSAPAVALRVQAGHSVATPGSAFSRWQLADVWRWGRLAWSTESGT
jgi:hypothetical protein